MFLIYENNLFDFNYFSVANSAFAETSSADKFSMYMISSLMRACPAEFNKAVKGKSILNLTLQDTESAITVMTLTTGYPDTFLLPGKATNVLTLEQVSGVSEICKLKSM